MEKTKAIFKSIIYYIYLLVLTVGAILITLLMWQFAKVFDNDVWKYFIGGLNGAILIYCLHGKVNNNNKKTK